MELKEKFKEDIKFVKALISQNGPDIGDFQRLNEWYEEIGAKKEAGEITPKEIDFLRECFEETYLTKKALQGFVYTKPYGYHGDFEIIDKIYTNHISEDKKFTKWDTWFHSLAATKAVRNRKEYFKKLLKEKSEDNTLKVLNLASGPCRDIAEFYTANPKAKVTFDCVEIDPNAIKYAKKLLQNNSDKVNFILANIFKYTTKEKYDLIWSAGLFDYFDDNTFTGILNRYNQNLRENGEIVIGNFHPKNSSRRTMEFGLWYLHHRSQTKLTELAKKAGFDADKIKIDEESEGVNLFMRIKR